MAETNDLIEFDKIVEQIFPILRQHIDECNNRTTTVVERRDPVDLWNELQLPSKASDIDQPTPFNDLLSEINSIFKYSVKSLHPGFANQLYGGTDMISAAANFLADILNAAPHTYNAAPVFSLMEESLIRRVGSLVGYPENTVDGTFAPGGSMSNLTALLIARNEALPTCRSKGLLSSEKKLVAFASQDGHYSISTAMNVLGLGSENLKIVPTLPNGAMDTIQLEKMIDMAIEQNELPFVVVSTAGTTVFGSFDDFTTISAICKRHNIWYHVDASWGGMAMLAPEPHCQLMRGADQSDSLVWNPHKGLGVPQQCSILVTRHQGMLRKWNATHVSYLYTPEIAMSVDRGENTIQCGRRNDQLKLHISWKYYGTNGFRERVDYYFQMRDYLVAQLKERHPRFVLVLEPKYLNVCFCYIPESLQGEEVLLEDENIRPIIHATTSRIGLTLRQRGVFMINFQPIRNLPNFFRMVFTNKRLTKDDIHGILDEIETIGKTMSLTG